LELSIKTFGWHAKAQGILWGYFFPEN
jgi:hypothetical protein